MTMEKGGPNPEDMAAVELAKMRSTLTDLIEEILSKNNFRDIDQEIPKWLEDVRKESSEQFNEITAMIKDDDGNGIEIAKNFDPEGAYQIFDWDYRIGFFTESGREIGADGTPELEDDVEINYFFAKGKGKDLIYRVVVNREYYDAKTAAPETLKEIAKYMLGHDGHRVGIDFEQKLHEDDEQGRLDISIPDVSDLKRIEALLRQGLNNIKPTQVDKFE